MKKTPIIVVLTYAMTLSLLLAACAASTAEVSPESSESNAPVTSEQQLSEPATSEQQLSEPATSEQQLTEPVTDDTTPEKTKGEVIPSDDINADGGADSYAGAGDNPVSRYYVNMDFYNAQSDDMLTILPQYKTYQQTTEWSCGNATALTALYHFGIESYTELDIAKIMGSSTDADTPGAEPGSADNYYEYGTNVKQMAEFFEDVPKLKVLETSYRSDYTKNDLITAESGMSDSYIGNLPATFSSNALYTSENSDESEAFVEDAADSYFVQWLQGHLTAGNVIMTEWSDWNGHWTAIIGYDNNGTPSIGDDILIFADPYDTSDHWQDGYAIYPLERWFYIWDDRTVAPKPYQVQPYIVVGKDQ